MGKKKSAKTAAAAASRVARKQPYDTERFGAVVERLREQAARINALAKAMDDCGMTDVVVDGHAMLLRGLNQVDNFTDNAARAIREARTAKEHH
jgi:hypothetical protein